MLCLGKDSDRVYEHCPTDNFKTITFKDLVLQTARLQFAHGDNGFGAEWTVLYVDTDSTGIHAAGLTYFPDHDPEGWTSMRVQSLYNIGGEAFYGVSDTSDTGATNLEQHAALHCDGLHIDQLHGGYVIDVSFAVIPDGWCQ